MLLERRILTLKNVECVPNRATECAFSQVGVTLDRESLRVHSHVKPPDDLSGKEGEQVEEGVDEHTGAVTQLREGLRCGRETEDIGGAGKSASSSP